MNFKSFFAFFYGARTNNKKIFKNRIIFLTPTVVVYINYYDKTTAGLTITKKKGEISWKMYR